MVEAAICVERLRASYRAGFLHQPFVALDGCDLQVAPGEILGVLGPNGSGKTTLLRVLAGTLGSWSGHVRVLGRDPRDPGLVTSVGYQPDAPLPFQDLPAEQLLTWFGKTQGLRAAAARERAAVWLQRLGLGAVARHRVKSFSAGMQRRVALAAAMLGEPKLLLLDEPTAMLDPEGSLLAQGLLLELAARGTAIVLASHHLQEVEEVCARVCLLAAGKVARTGSLAELLGTGDDLLVVRGLDAAGQAQVLAAITAAGGTLVRRDRAREHLYALFRRLGRNEPAG